MLEIIIFILTLALISSNVFASLIFSIRVFNYIESVTKLETNLIFNDFITFNLLVFSQLSSIVIVIKIALSLQIAEIYLVFVYYLMTTSLLLLSSLKLKKSNQFKINKY